MNRSQLRRLAGAATTCVLVVTGWALAAARLPMIVLPSPTETTLAVAELALSGQLISQLALTCGRALAGSLCAVLLGVTLGVAAAHSEVVDGLLTPIRLLLTGVPPAVTVVVAMIWLGPGGAVTMTAVVVTMTPALVIAGREAALAVDVDLVEMAHSFDVGTWWQIRHVILPAASSPILAAIATTASGALRLALMSEMLSATDGIGAAVTAARGHVDTAEVFAWAGVAVAFAVIVDLVIFGPLRRRTLGARASSSAAGATPRTAETSPAAANAPWPRTIEHTLGSTTIEKAPGRIVSTSVVLTGSLLALEAPVVASGASGIGSGGEDSNTDKDGFFSHWGDIARERGVEVLYQNSELNLEAVANAAPDLIILSAVGGDSTADAYQELSKIAPTVAVDYNSNSWQDVTTELGEITGFETEAAELITSYESTIADLATKVKAPSEPVQAIVFDGSGNGSAIALPGGPHDGIISALGFTLAPLPDGVKPDPNRKDFVFASDEQALSGLNSENLLLVSGTAADVEAMKKHPAYSRLTSVTSGKVVPLGMSSFKLDYYSALDMARRLAEAYPA